MLFLKSKHVGHRSRIHQITMICMCTRFWTKTTATQVQKRHEARIAILKLKLKPWRSWKQPAMDPVAFSRLSLAPTSQQTKAPLPNACTREEDEVVFKPRRRHQPRNGEQGTMGVQAVIWRRDPVTLGNDATTAQTNPTLQSGENKNARPQRRTPKDKAVYESKIPAAACQSVLPSIKAMKQLEGPRKGNTYLKHKSYHKPGPCPMVPAYEPLNVSPIGSTSLSLKPSHNAFVPYQTLRSVPIFRRSLHGVLTNCTDSPQPSVSSKSHQHKNILPPETMENGLDPLHIIIGAKSRA